VQFYEPSRVAGFAGVVAECAAVSGRNKCDRSECRANNVLFNGDIPEAGVDAAVSTAFAMALELIENGATVAPWRRRRSRRSNQRSRQIAKTHTPSKSQRRKADQTLTT
jgi:hypothetical protein